GRLLAADDVDAVIVIFIPPLAIRAEDVEAAITRAAATRPGKPVLANFLARRGVSDLRTVPSYRYPEAAAIALARVADYADWRRRPEGVVPHLADVDREGGRVVVDRGLALAPDGTVLDPPDADRLLACYGIKAGDAVVSLEPDPLFGPVLRV